MTLSLSKDRMALGIAALRSGEFIQGQEALIRSDSGVIKAWEDQNTGGLAPVVAQWYGLTEESTGCVEYIEDPVLTMANGHDTATAIFLNDDAEARYDFAYIADAFERTFING